MRVPLFLYLLFSSSSLRVSNAFLSSSYRRPIASVPSPVWAEPSDEPSSSSSSPEEPEKPRIAIGSHEELCYALGVNLARQLGDVRPLVNDKDELAQLATGLLAAITGRLSEKDQVDLLQRRGDDLNTMITERATSLQEKMKVAGQEVLEEMAATDGAVTLDSGVVLHVLESADESAVRPTKASTVKIHYHGTLIDGTPFDSTLGGEPVQFPLAGVIPGWRDAVLKMKEGETAMVGIPPDQGYGDKGTPDGRIPGGSTILFKIQLLEVLSAGIGGGPSLLGADGQKMGKQSGGLLGADGKPM